MKSAKTGCNARAVSGQQVAQQVPPSNCVSQQAIKAIHSRVHSHCREPVGIVVPCISTPLGRRRNFREHFDEHLQHPGWNRSADLFTNHTSGFDSVAGDAHFGQSPGHLCEGIAAPGPQNLKREIATDGDRVQLSFGSILLASGDVEKHGIALRSYLHLNCLPCQDGRSDSYAGSENVAGKAEPIFQFNRSPGRRYRDTDCEAATRAPLPTRSNR